MWLSGNIAIRNTNDDTTSTRLIPFLIYTSVNFFSPVISSTFQFCMLFLITSWLHLISFTFWDYLSASFAVLNPTPFCSLSTVYSNLAIHLVYLQYPICSSINSPPLFNESYNLHRGYCPHPRFACYGSVDAGVVFWFVWSLSLCHPFVCIWAL